MDFFEKEVYIIHIIKFLIFLYLFINEDLLANLFQLYFYSNILN